MRKSIKVAIASSTVLGALALAGPAFADGNPVGITANVGQTISMSGPPAALALNGNPGTTATGSVNYSVTSNDAAGYSITVSPGATALANSQAGASIPNSAMSYIPDNHSSMQFQGANALTVINKNTVSGAGGDSYNDQFSLAIPGNAVSGAYAETFTYLATGK